MIVIASDGLFDNCFLSNFYCQTFFWSAEATTTFRDLFVVQVAPGDVMVIASDGLFDNLFDEEIAEIVNALARVRFVSFQDVSYFRRCQVCNVLHDMGALVAMTRLPGGDRTSCSRCIWTHT